jgi:hypothetical protein
VHGASGAVGVAFDDEDGVRIVLEDAGEIGKLGRGVFLERRLVDLANDLGNLLNRTISLSPSRSMVAVCTSRLRASSCMSM